MTDAPSETKLRAVERELKKIGRRDAQRAVGGGVYMRLDSAGRRRFQLRVRQANGHAAQPGRTSDTWEEASRSRDERAEDAKLARGESRGEARETLFSTYASEKYWRSVVRELDAATRVQYRRVLWQDVVPFWGDWQLQQIERSVYAIDSFREWLRKHKTVWTRRVDGKVVSHTRHEIDASPKLKREFAAWKKANAHRDDLSVGSADEGRLEFRSAAADRALNMTKLVLDHAKGRNILAWNPAAGARRFHNKRELRGTYAGTHRPALESEILHPVDIERIAAATRFRGCVATFEQRVGLIEVLGFLGLRPNEALALRHRSWRNPDGTPRRFMQIKESLKPLPKKLITGQAKTGARDVFLFPAIAEQLERIYQAQGCPGPDALVFPSTRGGMLDLNNWRDGVWYPTLKRAGFIAKEHEAKPKAPGAFEPYRLRHSCATLMKAAERPAEFGGGRYSGKETARQLGHTEGTLTGVYGGILDDLHGVAGLTMDQIIREARRKVWGPLPGDSDYEDEWLTTAEAAPPIGLTINSLGNRIARGGLPARREGGRYLVSRQVLTRLGLIPREISQT